MESKILQVFYGNDALPYKDQERTVHYPIVGNGFQGANNTTQIKFYFSSLGDSSVTWVAVSKLPNGKIGSKVLQTYNDSELGEPYALLELDSFYTQYKGDVFISLQGYQGGVQVTYDEDTELYEIHGTPTIQATGSVKFTNNYATQFVGSGEEENINFQRILAALGTKLGIRTYSEHVGELPSEGSPDIFYVVNDDPNDPNLQNIYVWNENSQSYIWVGDNTLDLGNYYTKEQGDQFEEEIDNRVSGVENELSSVASGSPKGVYSTLAALQAAYPTGTTGIYVVSANGHWYYWNGSAWTDGGVYQAAEISNVNVLELDQDLQDAFNITFSENPLQEVLKHTNSKYIYNGQYNLFGEQANEYCDCVCYQVTEGKTYKVKVDAVVSSVLYGFCNSIPTTSTAVTPLSSDMAANIPSDQYLEYTIVAPANCYLLMSVKHNSSRYGVYEYEIDKVRAKVDDIPLSAISTSQEVLKTILVPLSKTNVNAYIYTDVGTQDSSTSQFKSVDTEVIANAVKIKIEKYVGVYGGAFLDENKQWISSFSTAVVGTEYDIPNNCKYINITVNMSDNDNRFSFITKTYKITNLENEYNGVIPSVWKDKKILCLGTSVSFGSGANENYIHYASEKLGFNLINTSVPGEAIQTRSDGTSMQWGSTSLSKSEYANQGITIADAPILPIIPNGNYNNYYRTWENIFNAENNDVDLYVFDVVPNNGDFSLTDWNNFNKSSWSYNNGTFADHRTTFLGALLFLMDKMYEINPNARMVFVLSSNFAYQEGKQALETIANYYKIPIIDLWSKINTSPKSIIKINQEDGANQHPTTFAHECMGRMFIGELMKIG